MKLLSPPPLEFWPSGVLLHRRAPKLLNGRLVLPVSLAAPSMCSPCFGQFAYEHAARVRFLRLRSPANDGALLTFSPKAPGSIFNVIELPVF